MERFVHLVQRLSRRRDEGATAVEYALLVALIAIVLTGGAIWLGQSLSDNLSSAGDCVASADDCEGGGGDDGGDDGDDGGDDEEPIE
jgi:pilus assembly protein Flp/PilA